MSLFQCEVCGCRENTALAYQGFRYMLESFDWSYAPERQGKRLCSACGPEKYSNGKPTEYKGQWHGEFERIFLPLGQFHTDKQGNLAHNETGNTDVRKYAMKRIYAFVNSPTSLGLHCLAIGEDGTVLAGHTSSHEGHAKRDLGVRDSNWQHDKYDAHFGKGLWMIEWLEDPKGHPGCSAALELCKVAHEKVWVEEVQRLYGTEINMAEGSVARQLYDSDVEPLDAVGELQTVLGDPHCEA